MRRTLLHAIAALAAETHQAFVELATEPQPVARSIGPISHARAGRRSPRDSPNNYVTVAELLHELAGLPSDTVTETTAAASEPTSDQVGVYMIPSTFGTLSAVQVVLGKAGVEDATKRVTLNIETPSLNSMMY
ncbi:MAG: hypothetical protein R2715_07190 [Ilumatobacteraceae bacterium]